MKFVFVHGWSFDRRFWYPLVAELACPEAILLEMGYFGAPPQLDLPNEPYIAIGHSAGFLWLLGQDLRHCQGLLALNGFARFAKGADFPDGVPTRQLARMSSRLSQSPNGVIADFHALCRPDIGWTGTPNIDRLTLGLNRLQNDDFRREAARWGDRLAWLSGADDPLLLPEVARASFPEESYGKFVTGGHLLPIAQPIHCATFIAAALDRLT